MRKRMILPDCTLDIEKLELQRTKKCCMYVTIGPIQTR